ncbi:MAG: hypothetical protein V4487_00575 [Chlamydiota bacterium]
MIALLAMTRVVYVSAWTGSGMAENINKALEQLEQSIDSNHQTIEIKDIKIRDLCDHAVIIYEILDK